MNVADGLEPVAAAGVVFVSPAGRILMLRRVDSGHHWAFPGGGIEAGETAEAAARREVLEETGAAYTGTLTPWTHRRKDGVDFTTFMAAVDDEFVPVLNQEHDQAEWITADAALERGGLHPGAVIALLRFDLDELGIARAMRIGELTSPQRYQNLLLIALRITGTGMSFRTKLNEYVWRDPSLYLNDDMLQRCQGLPVVVEHPETEVLDGTEFHERMIGSIFLPFIAGDEVWGIAKIYDEQAATMLETLPLSTSPGVIVGGKRQQMPNGGVILVEGEPSLVDHLAICLLGVWDKGGPAAGVINQSTAGDTNMAGEVKLDEDGKGMLTKINEHLTGLHEKFDGLSSRLDSLEGRAKKDDDDAKAKKDAEEKAKADAEEKAKLDAMSDEDRKQYLADKAKKDAEAEAAADDDDSKKNDDMNAKHDEQFKAINTRLDSFEGRFKEPTPEERAQFVAAQARADSVFQALGDSNGAPRFLQGETVLGYRKRLLAPMMQHSPAWKDTKLDVINDEQVIGNIEKQVFADAMAVAMKPVNDSASPVLRMVTTPDETGRMIKTFFGNPEATWGPFKQRAHKRLIGINTNRADR